ncbi:hypothetical protein BY996DRAFT_6416803 [Phakopsora pachyrhizi]|nr:hypothetical protein BY996DRAFT_6416803 [Phakopsora pachyrhizi]
MEGDRHELGEGEVLQSVDVVVIGAGASGLAGIRQIVDTTELSIRCFECKSSFGGVWNYVPDPGACTVKFDKQGRPYVREDDNSSRLTPMYESLRTNVPREIMGYKNFPFDGKGQEGEGSTSFPAGSEVLDYLSTCSKGYEKYVEFGTRVDRVRHLKNQGEKVNDRKRCRRWVVEFSKCSDSEFSTCRTGRVTCDFVLAANGHYSVPYIPSVKNLSTWKGEICHSLYYRNPKDPIFHGKNVAVIGIGPSGYDIVKDLAISKEFAKDDDQRQVKKLYSVASHPSKLGWDFRDPKAPSWTKLIEVIPRFDRIEDNKVYLTDGGVIDDIDVLYFSTGYLYSLPFCNREDKPWRDHPIIKNLTFDRSGSDNSNFEGGYRVHNLDKDQIFYYPDPSFGLLVLNSQVVPFPLADYQARAVAARWSGRKPFPIFQMENEDEESSSVHVIVPPKEFDVENGLLDKIGEGGKNDDDDCWGYVPRWKYKLRKTIAERRKKELGY